MAFHIGIVGTGNISRTHAVAVRDMPGVELAGFWGRNSSGADELSRKLGGRAFATLDDLLAQRPLDAVIIGTPSGLHVEHAMAAVRRGVHVLVEKPLDIDLARIDVLLEEAERAGVTVGVIYQDRTAPDLVWLKGLIDSGALGTLSLASAQVRWYRPPEYYASSAWRGTWALDGGGALMNQGIHTVDLLLWLLGDVRRAVGAVRTALHAIEVEDTAVATLEFASGVVGTLEVTTAAYPGFPRRVAISGSEGTVVVEGDRVTAIELRCAPPSEPPRHEGNANASASSPVVSDVRGHRRVIADFIDAVYSRRPPLCEGRDGRRSVALVRAIYDSASSASRGSSSNTPAGGCWGPGQG